MSIYSILSDVAYWIIVAVIMMAATEYIIIHIHAEKVSKQLQPGESSHEYVSLKFFKSFVWNVEVEKSAEGRRTVTIMLGQFKNRDD